MARGQHVDLDPGEEILAVARASFRGAAAVSTRATFALGSGRMRWRAFYEWHDGAKASGFGDVPPDMLIAVTDRRLLFGKPALWGRPPARYWSAIDLVDIAQVAAVRHGMVTGVAFGLSNGAIVEFEAMRGRGLRNLAQIIEARLQ